MATLDWPTATTQLRKALNAGLMVNGQVSESVYMVSSRSQPEARRVWTRGHVANCSCELSALGGKACPHGALVLFWAAWQRAEVAR